MPTNSMCTQLNPLQINLIISMLRVLHQGRNHMGWYQLTAITAVLPPPPSSFASPLAQASLTMSQQEIDPQAKVSNVSTTDGILQQGSTTDDFFSRVESFTKKPIVFHQKSANATQPDQITSHKKSNVSRQRASSENDSFEQVSKKYQPFLRCFLNCLVRSLAFVPPHESQLWKIVIDELKSTYTAAIVGLSFPCARDVGLGALADLRSSLNAMLNDPSSSGYLGCCTLVLCVTEELHERHISERLARKGSQIQSSGENIMEKQEDDLDDGARAFVQQMIIGSNPFPSNLKVNLGKAAKAAQAIHAAAMKASESPIVVEEVVCFAGQQDEIDRSSDSVLSINEETNFDSSLVHLPDLKNESTLEARKLVLKTDIEDNSPPNLVDSSSIEDDFIMYTDALKPETSDLSKLPEILQKSGTSQLQWTNYAGFFKTLEMCRRFVKDPVCNHEEKRADNTMAVETILNTIGVYLDVWDDNMLRGSQFSIVELFDSSSFGSKDSTKGMNHNANLMAHFIELASSEKSRVAEGKGSVLAILSESMDAAAEEFCKLTHHHMHSGYDGTGFLLEPHGERGIGDGGKDIYSRFVSYPTDRCFRRYVPDYLDHSGGNQAKSFKQDGKLVNSVVEGDEKHSSHEIDSSHVLDTSVGDLLEISSRVKIVDITKKISHAPSSEEDMSNASSNGEEYDDQDGLDIGFVDRSTFMNRKPVSDKSKKETQVQTDSLDSVNSTEYGAPTDGNDSDQNFEDYSNSVQHAYVDDEPVRQESSTHPIAVSSMTSFALPPSVTMGTGLPVECHWDNVIHVRAEGSRTATLLLTGSQFILEYDSELFDGEELAIEEYESRKTNSERWTGSKVVTKQNNEETQEKESDDGVTNRHHYRTVMLRPKVLRWAIAECTQIFLRRFRLRDSAMELFFVPSGGSGGSVPSVSVFIDFGAGRIGNAR